MKSIKVKIENENVSEWVFLGKKGQPLVFDTDKKLQNALKKIDEKLEPKVVGAIPVYELK